MPAVRVSQTVSEGLTLPTSGALVSQRCAEVLMAYPGLSPTTVTGAGVSQRLAEVLYLDPSPDALVSQRCVELLFSAASTGEGGAPGGGSNTTAFGFAT